jgi:hypothetical protein
MALSNAIVDSFDMVRMNELLPLSLQCHSRKIVPSELLVDYLGVSESQVKTVGRLTAEGKYELAASLLESSGDRFARSVSVTNAKRLVYLKLMEKHENTDPFKFIIYSAKIGEQTPQMAAPK